MLAGIGLTSSLEFTRSNPNPAFVNITNFGAIGDGADVAANIEAAIASMDVYGGILYFPPGVYGLGRPIANIQKPVTFMGAGKFSSFLRILFSNGNVITPAYSGISFVGLGWQTSTPRTGGDYIYWHPDAVEGLVENCRMIGGYGFVNIDSGSTVHINNVMLRDGVPNAPYMIRIGPGNDHKLSQVTTDNPNGQTAAGLLVDGALSLQVNSCDFIRGGKALYIKKAYSALFENTYFDSSVVGVYLEGTQPIVRSKFIGCGISSHSDRGVVVAQGAGGIIDDLLIHGCTIDFNAHDGVFIDKGNNIDLSHNTIAGNGGSGVLLGATLNKNDFSAFRNRIGGTPGAVAGNAAGVWNMAGSSIGEAFHFNNLKGNAGPVKGGNAITLPADNIT